MFETFPTISKNGMPGAAPKAMGRAPVPPLRRTGWAVQEGLSESVDVGHAANSLSGDGTTAGTGGTAGA